ncbi:MAG: hypothetical protein U1G05_16280 [Kiritimatiellia bacterium]
MKGGMVNEYGQANDLLRVTGTLAGSQTRDGVGHRGVLNMPVAALSAVAGNVVKTGEQAAGAVIHTGEAVFNEPCQPSIRSPAACSPLAKNWSRATSPAPEELVKGVGDTASSAAGTAAGAESAAAGGLAAAGTAVGGPDGEVARGIAGPVCGAVCRGGKEAGRPGLPARETLTGALPAPPDVYRMTGSSNDDVRGGVSRAGFRRGARDSGSA